MLSCIAIQWKEEGRWSWTIDPCLVEDLNNNSSPSIPGLITVSAHLTREIDVYSDITSWLPLIVGNILFILLLVENTDCSQHPQYPQIAPKSSLIIHGLVTSCTYPHDKLISSRNITSPHGLALFAPRANCSPAPRLSKSTSTMSPTQLIAHHYVCTHCRHAIYTQITANLWQF